MVATGLFWLRSLARGYGDGTRDDGWLQGAFGMGPVE